ncbi:MAG TPA: ABC transporter permease [Bacteroidota bacterium]|nr:ABC transporter permease [Bacteroidota bacterium]
MKVPFKYSLRSLGTRKLTTTLTMIGVALVVFVFAAVLMMAGGLQRAMVDTGSDDNVIILRKSANAEISSIIDRDQAAIASTEPEVAKSADGTPLATKEIVVIINLEYNDKPGVANVTVRGVSQAAFQIRPQVKLLAGRMFKFGSREVIVGSSIAKRFKDATIGQSLKFGGDQWTIVGTFEANGSGFESEIWGDVEQLDAAFNRPVFSSVTVRLANRDRFQEYAKWFESDNRLQTLEVKREKQFYEEQSELMATFIRVLGIVVTVIFSFGAMIGAMITMYAAVANRTMEIGTMRALGFRRRSILSAFLIEALLLSLLGGAAGLLLAALLQFFSVSMINFGTFTEIAFSFALSPTVVIATMVFSLVMGLIGGFLPAVRASRMSILNALRAG